METELKRDGGTTELKRAGGCDESTREVRLKKDEKICEGNTLCRLKQTVIYITDHSDHCWAKAHLCWTTTNTNKVILT